MQNKLHWAIHGHTAAELMVARADAGKPHMGLTTWKDAPKSKILKRDVTVAKNYLTLAELESLNRIVSMYLDHAELQAERQRLMAMADWAARLDAFLRFNEYEVLDHPGTVTASVARALAEDQYERFRVEQDHTWRSDFDALVERSSGLVKGAEE